MHFNHKEYSNNLLFIPLGGSNEIGINVNLYHYKGKWIMVDCGSGFADEFLPGVDMVVADLDFIAQNRKDLLGLVLTHAHEDHVGGIQYLWNTLQCPIYATHFTANFLKSRLSEYGLSKKVTVHVVKQGSKINLDPFFLELVPLTHSAPEMQALMIRTEDGNIFHTGDWKFDHDPLIGNPADEKLLKSYGDEGVLALVCDSTNVFNSGFSGSEGDLRKSLIDIIAGCTKMVVVATFASNLARLETLIVAGQKAGRKVVLTGRSMHRIFGAAQESGYLCDIEPLVDDRDVARFNKSDLLVIATGCQGEPLAAMNKIASRSHPTIKIGAQDTVIFSSKIIPGNEKKIFRLFNLLVKNNVEVITERDHFVHVSGHPSVEELKKLYSLIRPKACIPVHGEAAHIHAHAKLAKKSGIKYVCEVENGSVVLLDNAKPRIIDKVDTGYFAIDGNYLIPSDSNLFKVRRRMRDCGSVVVSIVLDKSSKLAIKPIISTPGTLDESEDGQMISFIQDEIAKNLESIRVRTGSLLPDEIKDKTKSLVKRIIKSEVNKNPWIIINVSYL